MMSPASTVLKRSSAARLPLPEVVVPRPAGVGGFGQVDFERVGDEGVAPTIETRRHEVLCINWHSSMGSESPILKGRTQSGIYLNRERAAQFGYEEGARDLTRLSVPTCMSGLRFVRDADDDAILRSIARTRPFGYRRYMPTEVGPSTPLAYLLEIPLLLDGGRRINGAASPYAELAALPYRVRLLNGAMSRYCRVQLVAAYGRTVPLTRIGGAEGLLESPAICLGITLAPSEPADMILDFRPFAGQALTLIDHDDQALVEFRIGAQVEGSQPWTAPEPLSR